MKPHPAIARTLRPLILVAVAPFVLTSVQAGPPYKVRTEFLGTNDSVYAVAVDEVNERVYIGGSFTEAAGKPRQNIAAYSTVTGELLTWNPGCNGFVYDIAVDGEMVYIGGLFTEVAAQPRKFAAKLDLGGNVQPWNPDPNAYIYAYALSQNSIHMCGQFSMVGGVTRQQYANAHKESGAPLFWSPGASGGSSYALAISGSSVYLGGSFTSMNGDPRERLAAVTTGSSLLPWNPTANGYVAALHVVGGTVYAGGGFTQVNGTERNRLAAIDTAGNLLPWNPQCDDAVGVFARSGNRLYAGGSFDLINGLPRHRIAVFDLAGNLLPWNPPAEDDVVDIAISKGVVYIVGDFESIGGTARKGFAAIYDPALLPEPRVTVRGKKRFGTARKTTRLRGRSVDSNLVEVKTGKGKFRLAKGVQTWSHLAKLKPGRNTLLVRSANAADATSKLARIVVFRR